MYTNYRNALASKLDRIRNLENSGYGIPREKETPTPLREHIENAVNFLGVIIAVLLLALFLMII